MDNTGLSIDADETFAYVLRDPAQCRARELDININDQHHLVILGPVKIR